MIARSQTEEEHLDHLQNLFVRLKEYKLRLNPNKCTFGVRSGKLLGFIVSNKVQHDESDRKEHAIYYLSKKFTDCETRYSLLEKTCCALVWVARRLRQYMLTHTTLLISMDPIKYIFEKPALFGRIARWQMILTEYDIQYTIQKAIKGSVLADHLAHQAVEDYQSMRFDFPDEDIMTLDDIEDNGPYDRPEQGS